MGKIDLLNDEKDGICPHMSLLSKINWENKKTKQIGQISPANENYPPFISK